MLLGGLRLTLSYGDYSTYSDAADRISDIPAITALESAASTLAAGQVYGTANDHDLVELSVAIAETSVRAEREGIDPLVAQALRQMTATSETIRSGGKGGSDPHRAIELSNEVVREAVATIDKLLVPIQISTIVTARIQLSDLLLGKLDGFNWLMAAMTAIQNPMKADDFHAADGSFVSMINTVERDLPSAKPDFDRVVRPNNAIITRAIVAAIRTGRLDLPELRTLALESRDVFTELGAQTVRQIVGDIDREVSAARSAAVRASAVVTGTLIAALVLAVLVARALLRPLRRLRAGATALADHDLPDQVDRISRGTGLEQIEITPIPVGTREEIGEIARTVDRLHTQALRLAAQQQHLRDQISGMFETMARRNQTLVDRQLSMIDALELEEKDPDRLGHLFQLDHLAARLRRNSANLLVLAGTKVRHERSEPVELRDIVRAALSEVEEYQRVKTGVTPHGWIVGSAATDVVHLVAELLENALRASPPDTDVLFAYSRSIEGGLLIEVIDSGIGIAPVELADINQRLSTMTSADLATTRRMGIFVVSRLAERHGITVRLRRTRDRAFNPGITASLHIPGTLTAAPLPTAPGFLQREPRAQLIRGRAQSGGSALQQPMSPRRTPESIRVGLSDLHRGVWDGRSRPTSTPFEPPDNYRTHPSGHAEHG